MVSLTMWVGGVSPLRKCENLTEILAMYYDSLILKHITSLKHEPAFSLKIINFLTILPLHSFIHSLILELSKGFVLSLLDGYDENKCCRSAQT